MASSSIDVTRQVTMSDVETTMMGSLACKDEVMAQAARHHLGSGGGRARARLALQCAKALQLSVMIAHMHRRVSDVISGQHADLEGDCTTIAAYNEVARMKSGPLLGLPVELCLIAADRSAHVSAAMAASDAIAIAYQTTDDISDAERGTETGGLNFLTIVQGDMKSRTQAARLHACEYARAAIAIAKTLPDGAGDGLIALTGKFIPGPTIVEAA